MVDAETSSVGDLLATSLDARAISTVDAQQLTASMDAQVTSTMDSPATLLDGQKAASMEACSIDELPDELLATIFSYLSEGAVLLDVLPLVCKRWREVSFTVDASVQQRPMFCRTHVSRFT